MSTTTPQAPPGLRYFGLAADADERALRRAYAQELKRIDPAEEPARFQALRENYEAALGWLRVQAARVQQEVAEPAMAPAEAAPARQSPHSPGREQAPEPRASQTLAKEVFETFLAQLEASAIKDRRDVRQLLDSTLEDPRLLDMDARFLFEWGVASWLAQGWRPGHENVFAPAIAALQWREDASRLAGLGEAGYVVDRAIHQLEAFDTQPENMRELQRNLIRSLRSDRHPGNATLVKYMPLVEHIVTTFPHWLHIITNTANVERWRQWDAQVPRWRRSITRRPHGKAAARSLPDVHARTPGWKAGLVALLVMGGLANLLSRTQSPAPHTSSYHLPAATSPVDARPFAPLAAPSASPSKSTIPPIPRITNASGAAEPDSPTAAFASVPRPSYPAASKRLGEQGKVIIKVLVRADGTAADAFVLQSSGFERLDQAALQAIQTARFIAAKGSDGKPVAAWHRAPFNFVLNDAQAREDHASYGDVVASAVRANIVFTKEVMGNPLAEIAVDLAADGRIIKAVLAKSSEVKEWDAAALQAVQRTGRIPLDQNGRVPPQMVIALRPKR